MTYEFALEFFVSSVVVNESDKAKRRKIEKLITGSPISVKVLDLEPIDIGRRAVQVSSNPQGKFGAGIYVLVRCDEQIEDTGLRIAVMLHTTPTFGHDDSQDDATNHGGGLQRLMSGNGGGENGLTRYFNGKGYIGGVDALSLLKESVAMKGPSSAALQNVQLYFGSSRSRVFAVCRIRITCKAIPGWETKQVHKLEERRMIHDKLTRQVSVLRERTEKNRKNEPLPAPVHAMARTGHDKARTSRMSAAPQTVRARGFLKTERDPAPKKRQGIEYTKPEGVPAKRAVTRTRPNGDRTKPGMTVIFDSEVSKRQDSDSDLDSGNGASGESHNDIYSQDDDVVASSDNNGVTSDDEYAESAVDDNDGSSLETINSSDNSVHSDNGHSASDSPQDYSDFDDV